MQNEFAILPKGMIRLSSRDVLVLDVISLTTFGSRLDPIIAGAMAEAA